MKYKLILKLKNHMKKSENLNNEYFDVQNYDDKNNSIQIFKDIKVLFLKYYFIIFK